MAAYDLEEQEQIDNLKAWWHQHGGKVAGIMIAIAIGVASWQGWNWHENQQAAKAGMLFSKLNQALMEENQPQQVRALAGELMEKYGGTNYAVLGALLAARSSFEANDLKTARAQLSWAVERGEPEVQDIARLRLAGIMLDEKEYDEALQTLMRKPVETFAPAYAELKADILLAQGNRAESRVAYREAFVLLKTQKQQAKTLNASGEADATGDVDPQQAEEEEAKLLAEEPAMQLLKQKLDALGDA